MKMQIKIALVCGCLGTLLVGCAANTPAPVSSLHKDYSQIKRGSYRGSYYEVQKGDTLYYIAYITNKDVKDLIRYNNLSEPYVIQPGQKLRLWRPVYKAPAYGGTGAGGVISATKNAVSVKAATAAVSSVSPSKSVSNSIKRPTSQKSNSTTSSAVNKLDQNKSKEYLERKQNVNNVVSHTKPSGVKVATNTTKVAKSKTTTKSSKIGKWLWPTKGRVIRKFSSGELGNKGIDIAGQRGQSVISTAGGVVVYSGNALRGYGNLIIVKHNDNYLSAYAHNDSLLVREGQSVNAGQKIATMGSSGSNRVKLHFEIRYQGKSVNPQRYLP